MDKYRKRILTIILVFAMALPMLFAGAKSVYADPADRPDYSDREKKEEVARSGDPRTIESVSYDPATKKTTVTFAGGSTEVLDGEYTKETAKEYLDKKAKEDAGIEKKSGQQKWFEEHVLAQVLNMNAGEADGSLSTVTLLDRTFVYAIAIIEGADKVPSDYSLGESGLAGYGGITHEKWYLFLEVAAMLIMLIRFAAEYSMDQVWQPTERNTPEQMFKPIFRLIVGFVFILCVHHFLALGLYLSQAAFSVISSEQLSSESISLYEEMCTTISEMLGFKEDSTVNAIYNTGALMSGVITFAIPYLVSVISGLGVIFVVFSRVLELVVRALFAPLAMTDCYKSGEHTHGFRYIFEFFGVAFQSLAIFGVLWVSGRVCGMFVEYLKTSEEAGALQFNYISQMAIYIAGLKLAQLTMLMKTSSLARSVFS